MATNSQITCFPMILQQPFQHVHYYACLNSRSIYTKITLPSLDVEFFLHTTNTIDTPPPPLPWPSITTNKQLNFLWASRKWVRLSERCSTSVDHWTGKYEMKFWQILVSLGFSFSVFRMNFTCVIFMVFFNLCIYVYIRRNIDGKIKFIVWFFPWHISYLDIFKFFIVSGYLNLTILSLVSNLIAM